MSRLGFYRHFTSLYRSLLVAPLLAIVLSLFPLQNTCQAENLTGQLQFAEGTYRINVGDVLRVDVYNQPDLSSSDILVRSDGNASFNGVGEIQLAGKTIREATVLLESQVRELVREPRISLTVSESKPPTVYLAGAIMRPGMLQAGTSNNSNSGGNGTENDSRSGSGNQSASRMDFRLSSVLAASGGVKLNADLANVMVTRDGAPFRTVNLWHMLKQGDNEADLMLQNGDSVYVPELPEQALDDATYRLLLSSAIGPKTFPVRIIGAVKQPGVYELNGSSPYLNSVIAKGGGYNLGANRKVIALRRFSAEDKFTTLFIDPNKHDFMLRPNDVVFVSEKKMYQASNFTENVSKLLSPFTNMSSVLFGLAMFGGGLR